MATIRKRVKSDGTVSYQAIVRKSGQKIYETFSTKAQATGWARQEEVRLERKGYAQPKDFEHLKLRDYFQRYIDEVLPGRKTEKNTSNRFLRFMKEPFAKKSIIRVRAEDIDDWKRRELKRIKPASVVRDMNSLGGFFTWVTKELKVPIENPMKLVSRPANADVTRDRTFTPSEVRRLLREMGYTHKPKYYKGTSLVGHAFLLAARTAMRCGEIASIRWTDIHLDEQWLYLPNTKNGRSRAVPLSTKSVRLLQRMRFEGKEKLIPVQSEALGKYFRDAKKKLGLLDVRFHDSRHHATTNLVERFPNVLELAAVTGHRDLKHLKRYYNPKASALAKKLG